MEGASDPSPSDRVIELLEENAHREASTYLEGIPAHPVDDRKTTIHTVGCKSFPEFAGTCGELPVNSYNRPYQSLQSVAADRPALVGSLCPVLTTFLEDEKRSVRLSTAKLFVAVGEADAASVEPVANALADRLADESVHGTTQEIVADITAPDADDTCPHCGLALPESGPPTCPRCGAPY